MTLLAPHDDRPTDQTPRRPLMDALAGSSARASHSYRGLLALLGLVGLLVWAALTAPQVISLAPRFASVSLGATQWISRVTSGSAGGMASGMALGSVTAPGACSSASASAVGSSLTVPAGAWVCGDALAVGGSLDVQGRVQGMAQAIGGSVTVSGEVDGDVTAVGGSISLLPGAQVHGKLNAIGGQTHIAPGAVALGASAEPQPDWFGGHSAPTAFRLVSLGSGSFWLGLLFWVSATLGLTAFVPEAVGHVRYTVARRLALSGISGALIGLVGALLALALFVTCIGIPVTVAIAFALWLAWVVGTVAFGSWLGASLLRGGRRDRNPSLIASTLLGVVLLSLLKAIPVVGVVVSLLVGCVAVGAAILTLLSAHRVSYARLRW